MQLVSDPLRRWTLRLRTGEPIHLWAHDYDTDGQTDEYVFTITVEASADEVGEHSGVQVPHHAQSRSGRVDITVLRIPVRCVTEVSSRRPG